MSCVYKILNKVNSRSYIGSSVYFPQRKATHLSKLRKNIHPNNHLQNSFNKYGEDNFEFVILETCLKENLIEREQYYIDNNFPEYNKRLIAESNLGRTYKMKDEHKYKIGKSKRILKDEDILIIKHLIKCGKLLKDLSKIYKINPTALSRAVNGRTYKELTVNSKPLINNNKLNLEQIKEIYIRSNNKENQYLLAKEFNVTQSAISRIKNKKINK